MPHILANGVNLHYEMRGPEGAPVVVFSTSVGATLEMWDGQANALTGRFRVLRYDTRGHGRSQTLLQPVSIADLADDLAGLLDGLNIHKAHVVGLSLGGMTAQSFAVRHKERLSSLTLMATSAYLPLGWDERIAAVKANGLEGIADVIMARWFTAGFLQRAPQQVAAIRARFVSNNAEGYMLCGAAIRDMDLRDSLSGIEAPTLLIAGNDDPATTLVMMEDVRTRIAGAEMVILPGVAHLLNIERPDLVNRHLLAFIDAHCQAGTKTGAGTSFEAGLANRKAVLGAAHVERSLANAGAFALPWQEFVTRTAWSEIWGDPTLPWKTRSMLTLTMMVALHREEEFKLHLRPALKNGVSLDELRAMLLQTAIYAGVPAANAAFRWVKEVLGDELNA